MPPGGGPPVMHQHDPGEIYYVLEGTFTFYVGHPGNPEDVRRGDRHRRGCRPAGRWNSTHRP